MATTFKTLADYADFSKTTKPVHKKGDADYVPPPQPIDDKKKPAFMFESGMGLVYRFEIHLPDTQNVETFRAIFKAMREELMS